MKSPASKVEYPLEDGRVLTLDSRVIEAVRLVTDSNFFPGFDLVIGLKGPDGVSDELRVLLRVASHVNAPGVVEKGAIVLSGSGLGREEQCVDGVLLHFRRPHVVADILSTFSDHFRKLASGLEGGQK